jgi:putative transcriptional regulator
MSKFGQKLIKAAGEARTIARGRAHPNTYKVHVPADVDVRQIRAALGITQAEFAGRFGIDVATVRDWEQGRRRPEGPARVLLMVIKHNPRVVERALRPLQQAS